MLLNLQHKTKRDLVKYEKYGPQLYMWKGEHTMTQNSKDQFVPGSIHITKHKPYYWLFTQLRASQGER